MKRLLSFYCCLILSVFSVLSAYASDGPALVGSLHKTNDVTGSATDIVLAKFTDVKATTAYDMNGQAYHGQIAILEALKGNESGNIKVGFSVIRGPKDTEAEPNLNDTYIIILVQHHVIHKILPATEDNIARIKALIAATPTPASK